MARSRSSFLVPLGFSNPWLLLLCIWIVATGADRLWLAVDQGIPAWDPADYLNSAVDHGRALGLLPGGGWPGLQQFLHLSPKIPPMASLVNGSAMAITGELPDQAAWVLALWHGLLLLVLFLWGKALHSPALGLLAALLAALTPALALLRVEFFLDLPLTATTTMALWLLWRWQRASPDGGQYHQSILAALGVAAAIMVKQSALLVLVGPCLWAGVSGFQQRHRSLQVLMGLALITAVILPWLHQNWVTTIGGTHRAVLQSAAAEGDPPPLSLGSLLWYPRLWQQQLGVVPPLVALGGLAMVLHKGLVSTRTGDGLNCRRGWPWLLICTLSGWFFITLSPNKDGRYIAPLLPLLLLWLSLFWLVFAERLQMWLGRYCSSALMVTLLMAAAAHTGARRMGAMETTATPKALPQLVRFLRRTTGDAPITLLVLPGSAHVNEHTATFYGRLNGGQLLGRSLGDSPAHHHLVLDQAEWIVLANGDQGHHSANVKRLSHAIRQDGRFQKVGSWPEEQESRRAGERLELWRRAGPEQGITIAERFVELAQGLADGPVGLARFMEQIGPMHQLDGHFLYQDQVHAWSGQRLQTDPHAADALWSLAAMAILNRSVSSANHWLLLLEEALPHNPWPTAYRAAVFLTNWQAGPAKQALRSLTPAQQEEPLLRALVDLAATLGGDLPRLPALHRSLQGAIEQVQEALSEELSPDTPEGELSPAPTRASGNHGFSVE